MLSPTLLELLLDWYRLARPQGRKIADVPGARNVKPELLPEGVQHLSNVSARGSGQGF
jgi:hypothetical protein